MNNGKPDSGHVRAVDELDSGKVFAGCLVGDNWVVCVVAHVDHQLGIVYPYRWQHRFFPRTRRQTPSAADLDKAVTECWAAMGRDVHAEFSRFFLCLPAWACRSRDAEDRLVIDGKAVADLARPRVEPPHVRMLEDLVCSRNALPGYMVADLVHHGWVTDTGSRIASPLGATTQSLLLQAHLVQCEFSYARILLDCLHRMDIDVDVLVSPFSATAANLYPEDRQAGVTLIEVDRWKTSCSCSAEGVLVHTALVEGGSCDVLAGAARDLGTSSTDLAEWLNEREELLRYAVPTTEICWPSLARRAGGPHSLGDIDDAAAPVVARLLDHIRGELQQLPEGAAACTGNVVLMGDDPLTLRGLQRAILAGGGVRCEWRLPDRVHGTASRTVPGYARMIGLMRMGAWSVWKGRRQPFLETYRGGLSDVVSRRSPGTLRGVGLSAPGLRRARVAPRRFGEVVRHWLF